MFHILHMNVHVLSLVTTKKGLITLTDKSVNCSHPVVEHVESTLNNGI